MSIEKFPVGGVVEETVKEEIDKVDRNEKILEAIDQALGNCSGERIDEFRGEYGVYLDRPEAISFVDGVARVKIYLQIRTGEYYDIPDSALLTCEIDIDTKSIHIVDAKDGGFVNGKLADPEKPYDEEGELSEYFSLAKDEADSSEDEKDADTDDFVVDAMKELIDWEALERLALEEKKIKEASEQERK